MYRMTDGCGNFIDASEDERVLIDNCNLRGSNRGHNYPCIDCPYSDQCNEFFLKYLTIPYLFEEF